MRKNRRIYTHTLSYRIRRLDTVSVGIVALMVIATLWMGGRMVWAQPLLSPKAEVIVTPTPTPAPLSVLPPTVEEAIWFHFKDQGDQVVSEAMLVARCESGLKPQAVNDKNRNKTTDTGVFQVNSVHQVPPRFLKDVSVNVAIAAKLYREQGWVPWSSSRRCHGL